jgi:hypothetical protein
MVVVCFFGTAGGTRHLYYLTPQEAMRALKLNYIYQPFAIAGLGLGKIAVALFILRIVSNRGQASRWPRIALWSIICITAILSFLMCLFTFVQCENPEALWNPAIAATTKCWDPQVQPDFSIFGGSWNAFADFILAIWPGFIVWGLEMAIRKKVWLTVLLGLGVFSSVSAAIKVSHLSALSQHSDLTWETFDLYLWTGIESFLILVCGTIPTLKPLFDKYISKKIKSLYGTSHGSSGHPYSFHDSRSRNTSSKRRSNYVHIDTATESGHELRDNPVGEDRSASPKIHGGLSEGYADASNRSEDTEEDGRRHIRVTSSIHVHESDR